MDYWSPITAIGTVILVMLTIVMMRRRNRSSPKKKQLDAQYSHISARLFFLPPFFYFPLSRLRNLNHIPRDKIIINWNTKKAFYVGTYALGLLRSDKADWFSERKPFLRWIGLDEWCQKEKLTLVHREASPEDVIEGTFQVGFGN